MKEWKVEPQSATSRATVRPALAVAGNWRLKLTLEFRNRARPGYRHRTVHSGRSR
jgi:hypothetical protein